MQPGDVVATAADTTQLLGSGLVSYHRPPLKMALKIFKMVPSLL